MDCMKGHNFGCITNLHQCAKFLFAKIARYAFYTFLFFLGLTLFNHRIIFLKTLVLSRYYRSAIEVLTRCYRGANVVLSICYPTPTRLSFCCPRFLKKFQENLFCTFKFLFSVRFSEYDGYSPIQI